MWGLARETESTVNSEEDNAENNQRDETVNAGDAEEAGIENAQQDTDVMKEVRSLDAHQGTKDAVVEQQRTDATSSRSLLPKVKTRI